MPKLKTPTPVDENFMSQAVACVKAATHRVSPNPMVGCVIVKDGVVVGSGVTETPGRRHAEVVALDEAKEQARGADMYVTLEPCCHTGRTPPCTNAIVKSGIKRVFVGVVDPNPVVHTKGLKRLADEGIETVVGVLADECQRLLAPFQRFIIHQRPWIILKAATSLDGRIATPRGDSKWITGALAREDAHRLRAQVDAIMVGGETVRLDDPQLTVRDAPGTTPMRVIVDTLANIPSGARVLGASSIVFHGPNAPQERISAIESTGAKTQAVELDDGGVDLDQVLEHLARLGVVRCMVEGGGRIHGSLLKARLAQEAWFYLAPKLLGEGRPLVSGIHADGVHDAWRLEDMRVDHFGCDLRIRGRIRYSSESQVGDDE